MTVSKRLRFEVLRRDAYTCRYCGRSAPAIPLTVDHVLPLALGGLDEPTNLVACCRDCNSGKSSIAPDASLIENVLSDAFRWGAAIRAAVELAEADRIEAVTYRTSFRAAWDDWSFGERDKQTGVPLDASWETSVENFRIRGLPLDHLTDCIKLAMDNPRVAIENVFRYLCGIAWNRLASIEAGAHAIIAAESSDGSRTV